ncbi:MAG: cytochrome C554 [Bacteroidetes bacterium]|nr:cytochrome C554 [Bacteroidota bacterium]
MSSKKLLAVAVLAIFAIGALQAQDFKYIGAAKCKMCHIKASKGEQYKLWLEGPHANALKVLSSPEALAIAKEKGIADPKTDSRCLKCHITVGHIDKSLSAGIKSAEGVSCESCHGPGSRYKDASIMTFREMSIKNGLILPTEKVCKNCHNRNSPRYKPFVFKERVAKIAHPRPKVK